MSFWFLSSFVGNLLGGYLGTFYNTMKDHSRFFALCAGLAGICAGGIFLVKVPVENLLKSSKRNPEYKTMIDASDMELVDVA